ncbi:MAG: Co2+/Mg2+ efflux protein ApaG [Gammaproteobacteria bacterium]|nr:Co2+/Mg2+ efflux protein ApaG [Gammaproteobacteria bacterium]
MKNLIDVSAVSAYLVDQSSPEAGEFAFAYTITITNKGEQGARLLSRHWIITDGNSEIQEVKGDGVVGEQPMLPPGASFEYTSGTLMPTPMGTMRGSYQMLADDGTMFDADIPQFSLVAEKTLH